MRGSQRRGPPLNGPRVVLRPRFCADDKTPLHVNTGLEVFVLGRGGGGRFIFGEGILYVCIDLYIRMYIYMYYTHVCTYGFFSQTHIHIHTYIHLVCHAC